MIIEIMAVAMDGEGIGVQKEAFTVSIDEPTKMIFSHKFIIDQILESKEDRIMNFIKENPFLVRCFGNSDNNITRFPHAYNHDLIGNELRLIVSVGINDSYDADITIGVVPNTDAEFECLFKMLMDRQLGSSDMENATLILPKTFKDRNIINYFGGKVLGEYLIIHGCKELDDKTTDYYRGNIDYWHVIKINSLLRQLLVIHAKKDMVPHLIGGNGREVATVKNVIDSFKCYNTKRIRITPV